MIRVAMRTALQLRCMFVNASGSCIPRKGGSAVAAAAELGDTPLQSAPAGASDGGPARGATDTAAAA